METTTVVPTTTTVEETQPVETTEEVTTTTAVEETQPVPTETTTQAPTQPETQPVTTTQAPTTQPETTTQAPTEAPTVAPTTQPEIPTIAPTEAPTTQPETTTQAPTEPETTTQGGCWHQRSGSDVVTKEPTCTEDGVISFACDDCGEILVQYVNSIPNRHNQYSSYYSYTVINRVEPTCTSDGYSGDKICSYCSEVFYYGIVIDSYQGHTWDDLGTASCSKYVTHTKTCTTCGEQVTTTFDLAPHDYVNGICSRCGDDENNPTEYTTEEIYIEIH